MQSQSNALQKIRATLAAAALSLCAACSSTPAELEAKSAPISQAFKENYQEIYRRIAGTARRCMAGNIGAQASMAVDTELFPDLGYGEITVSLINWGVRNYYLSARIEKTPTGSLVTAKAGNALAAERLAQSAIRWAAGEQDC